MSSRWLLLLVLPLAGCVMRAHGPPHRHGGNAGHDNDLAEAEEVGYDEEGQPDTKARKRRGETVVDGVVLEDDPPREEEPDGDDPDGFATPHTKRPGATEREKAAEPRTVTFTEPGAKLQPVHRNKRPALPDPATLSVAFVRDGELAFSAEAVLELDVLLAKESAVKMLVSLGQPERAQVGLKELAAEAHTAGWDLLLVDVREGATRRIGYLLHASSGALLARYEVSDKGVTTPVSTGKTLDLPERLAASYARLTK